MNLLVIGGGGREHAIVKKLKENPAVETIYCAPGNGGIAAEAECVAIKATVTPLPSASPSAFKTIGNVAVSRYLSAESASVKFS